MRILCRPSRFWPALWLDILYSNVFWLVAKYIGQINWLRKAKSKQYDYKGIEVYVFQLLWYGGVVRNSLLNSLTLFGYSSLKMCMKFSSYLNIFEIAFFHNVHVWFWFADLDRRGKKTSIRFCGGEITGACRQLDVRFKASVSSLCKLHKFTTFRGR